MKAAAKPANASWLWTFAYGYRALPAWSLSLVDRLDEVSAAAIPMMPHLRAGG